MKNLKDYLGKKVAIACRTDEEAKFVNDFMTANGGRSLYHYWVKRKEMSLNYHNCIEFNLYKIPQNTYCYEGFYRNIGFTVYEASEFMSPIFEKGKWYKHRNWYIKFSYLNSKNIFVASEYIDNNRNYRGNLYDFTCGDDNNKTLLTDLSEIQQYLPDGHPDKTEKKFSIGRWYKGFSQDGSWYGKIEGWTNEVVPEIFTSELILNTGKYINHPVGGKSTSYKTLELLENLNEIQEYLPDGHPDKIVTIPLYVKYIDTQYKGEIVKVEDWKCGSYCKVIFSNGNREQPFKHLLQVSTEEEYLKQESSKEEEFVLPKKWCVKVTQENKEVLDSWRKKQPKYKDKHSLNYYLISDPNSDSSYCSYNEKLPYFKFYKEITFEQFKKYVLKESTNEESVIIKEKENNPSDSKEVVIPKLVKVTPNISFDLSNDKLPEINIPITKKPTKVLSPIKIETFKLNINL